MSYNIYNMYNRNLRNDAQLIFREGERERERNHFSDQYFPVFYVNIRPSFSKTE